MKKHPWLQLLWLLVPVLVIWSVRDAPLADILRALSSLSVAKILLLAALNTIILLLVSGRWWLILRAQGYTIRYLSVAAYRLVAFGISYFTPGPQFGGEPAQVYYMRNRHGISTSSALASVSLDKILELLANFGFLLVGIFAALGSGLLVELAPIQAVAWMAGPFILLLTYTLAIWKGKSPLASLLTRLPQRRGAILRLTRATALAEEQISQFCQRKPLVVLGASVLSILIWGVMTLEYWLALRFLGIQVDLLQAVAALTAARIAFLFPLPGGLGALEASQILAMEALGLNPALGLSISLLIRGRDITLGGLGILLGGIMTRRRARVVVPNQATERRI
ncbi:MAG TPA: lysylphosphatidylglycerol synthase transmembrane domain-containing protein [Anaerolineales bacterium]